MKWTSDSTGPDKRTSGTVCGQDPRSVYWFSGLGLLNVTPSFIHLSYVSSMCNVYVRRDSIPNLFLAQFFVTNGIRHCLLSCSAFKGCRRYRDFNCFFVQHDGKLCSVVLGCVFKYAV
jgi:hypothetical protein